jgi:hypothetical protein
MVLAGEATRVEEVVGFFHVLWVRKEPSASLG